MTTRPAVWLVGITLIVVMLFPMFAYAVCVDKPDQGITCNRDQEKFLNPSYILNEQEAQIARQCYDPRFEIFDTCWNRGIPQYSQSQYQAWEDAWARADAVLAPEYGMKYIIGSSVYGCLTNISHHFCNHPIVAPDNPCYADMVAICVHAVEFEKNAYRTRSNKN